MTHPPLSPADLAALRALCEAATPGPWIASGREIDQLTDAGKGYPLNVYPDSKEVVKAYGDDEPYGVLEDEDAAFIAASRTALPRLLSELESARRELDEARRFGEEAARKYNDLISRGPVLTCAFCGWEYASGTPATGHAALTAHVMECEKHPLRAHLESARRLLERALVVAGNAAAHWHALEGVTLAPGECPGCSAEDESKATLDEIRAFLARGAEQEKPKKLCGKYLGDNDATCPQLTCIRFRGHEGLCDNVQGDPA